MAPGRDRLLAVANAYLDECLRHRGVRALLLEARVDPAIIEAIVSRNKLAIQRSSPDFAAMGWAHPEPSAAMWNSAVVESAILELNGGGYQPDIRAALAQFLPEQR